MRRSGPSLQLAFVTMLALGSLVLLLVAHPDLRAVSWERGDDVAITVAWTVAVAACAWLFVVTGACVIALGCAQPQLARRLAPTLPVAIRRMVEVAVVGASLVVPALPAHAAAPPASAVTVADQPVVRAPETPAPHAAPTPSPPTAVTVPGRHVVVHAGDNLWLIARAALAGPSGPAPSEADILRYWHAVIAANRSTLRSGDPSLIFPGEVVTLPSRTAVS